MNVDLLPRELPTTFDSASACKNWKAKVYSNWPDDKPMRICRDKDFEKFYPSWKLWNQFLNKIKSIKLRRK